MSRQTFITEFSGVMNNCLQQQQQQQQQHYSFIRNGVSERKPHKA